MLPTDTPTRQYVAKLLFVELSPLRSAYQLLPVERMPLPMPRDAALRLDASGPERQLIFTWKWDAGFPSEELVLAPETSAVDAFVAITNALERSRPWAHGGALAPKGELK